MIEQNEILSLVLFLERSDPYTVLYARIDTEENTERMTYDGMSFVYPFFLIFDYRCKDKKYFSNNKIKCYLKVHKLSLDPLHLVLGLCVLFSR